MDDGSRSSYLLLAKATPVYSSTGEVVGKVKRVLCEPAADIFDGLEVTTSEGARYVPAEHVAAIHGGGVDLSITTTEVVALPAPRHRPRIKWDLDHPPPHLWRDVELWLVEHLPHRHPALDLRLKQAEHRLIERQRALKLAHENPKLAIEAGIGRPDLPGSDDSGVIDLNHAPAEVMIMLPGLDEPLAEQIVEARERISGFTSVGDGA